MPEFKTYENKLTLCLTVPELVKCGVNEDYLVKKALPGFRNGIYHNWPHHKEGNRVFIHFDGIKEEYKQKVKDVLCGGVDVAEYMRYEPIKRAVILDPKAEQFYIEHRLSDGRILDPKKRIQYTHAASWLNMLNDVTINYRLRMREVFGIDSMGEFWGRTVAVIKAEKIKLPASYRRLKPLMNEYRVYGYECLIDGWFDNKNAYRLGKTPEGFNSELYEQQISLIRKVASRPNNFNSQQVNNLSNIVFDRNEMPVVSRSTVWRIMKQNEKLIQAGRRGVREWSNQSSMHVKRERPYLPLRMLTLDGWTAELYYQDEHGYSNRLVMVVVLDPCIDYPLGYAIGGKETAELIRQGVRNALMHVRELTGDYYRPYQIQSDHYGIKQNTPFFEAAARLFTPAAVGNAKSKVIEPYFRYINNTYCQLMTNWSGHNVDAKKSNQVNREYQNLIKKEFPDMQGCIKQLESIIQHERNKKGAEYIKRLSEVPTEDKVLLTVSQQFELFGTSSRPALVNGGGVVINIDGQRVAFDSFDPKFRQLGQRFSILYQPQDLTNALAISEDGKHRFIVEQKRAVAMDIKSRKDGDGEYLKRIKDFNAELKTEIMRVYVEDDAKAEPLIANSSLNITSHEEAALKAMFTDRKGQQKEALQAAKRLKEIQGAVPEYVEKSTQEKHLEYLKGKIDFDEYLD